MSDNLKDLELDDFFAAILNLKDQEECYNFFSDICTIKELFSFSQRLSVAKMLSEGRTYLEITDVTGASTATISRVNRALSYGRNGYKEILERLKENK